MAFKAGLNWLPKPRLFAAVMGLFTKMAISLSTLVMGYLLLWFGLGAQSGIAPSPEMLHRLNWTPVLLNIFFNLGALVFTLMFPMDEAAAAEVRRQLDERRLAKAATGEPTDEVAEEFVHEHPRQAAAFVQQHPEVIEEIKTSEK